MTRRRFLSLWLASTGMSLAERRTLGGLADMVTIQPRQFWLLDTAGAAELGSATTLGGASDVLTAAIWNQDMRSNARTLALGVF